MKFYILGINSFIAKNLYITIRNRFTNDDIYCLNHKEVDNLKYVTDDDIIINCCGVNRGSSDEEYMNGNYHFLESLINSLNNKTPYLIHISSFLVNGFEDTKLSGYTKIFVESKLKGEDFLKNIYPNDKLCILRPSNIYGYNCEPYYNNILVTMIYESITQEYKTTSINKNCYRNFLSIDGLIDSIIEIIDKKEYGTYNIISNNTISLDKLVNILYSDNNDMCTKLIDIIDGEKSMPKSNLNESVIIIDENINNKIIETKEKMIKLIEIKKLCPIKKLNCLSQPRGEMVEISNLNSNRLYMITITQNSFRGNHFHYKQIEEFYVNYGKVIFLLSLYNDPRTVLFCILQKRDMIQVNPYIIHTLANDFIYNEQQTESELFITSTQEYIPNVAVDTTYINILN